MKESPQETRREHRRTVLTSPAPSPQRLGFGIGADGGGIWTQPASTCAMTSCTIADNASGGPDPFFLLAPGAGGGVASPDTGTTVVNSIAGSNGPDLSVKVLAPSDSLSVRFLSPTGIFWLEVPILGGQVFTTAGPPLVTLPTAQGPLPR